MSENSTVGPCWGLTSTPVWKVYPFTLALNIPEKQFHETRARLRMKAGYTALELVDEAYREQGLWNESTPAKIALERKERARAMRLPAKDRALLGC
jgi:hypothetical protein